MLSTYSAYLPFMNAIIKLLILADIFLLSGFGLVNPIFAIFVKEGLAGGSIAAVGIASTIYLITKAILQLPLARWTDKEPASVREFWTLITGYFLIALIPFLFLLIKSINQLYLIQLLHGVAAALAYPGFMSIFTKFADHQKAGYSWSIYSTSVILGMAVAAGVGGWLGEMFGFRVLFVIVGVFAFLGFFATLGLSLFYDQLKLVRYEGLKSLNERLSHVLGRHKHPIAPPGKIDEMK